MFGIQDPWIWSVYILCILSTTLCIAYGMINWNSGTEEKTLQEDRDWAAVEDKIVENL